jgi:membrane protease YdiL (CAAX protease family)
METVTKPKLYGAFAVFIAAILLLVFIAAPIQEALGLWGLFLTEVMLAACGILPVYIFGYKLRDVVPFRRPMLRQVFGVLLLWIGALLVGYLGGFVTMLIFPSDMAELGKALSDFMTDGPILPALFATAVMPALCEETLCRGFIQYSLGGLKRKWLVVLIVGVLFGIFHLSYLRFLPTMVLGFALAYIMAETQNILLPMLLHFVNNAVSVSFSYAVSGAQNAVDAATMSSAAVVGVGVILFLCAVAPWLIIAGSRLLRTKEANREKPLKNKHYIAAGIISAFCIIGGIAVTVVGAGTLLGDMQVLNVSYTETVSSQTEEADTYPVVIDTDGTYQLTFAVSPGSGADGSTSFKLTRADGTVFLDEASGKTLTNTQVQLPAGDYELSCVYDYQNKEPADIQVSIVILKVPS